MIISTRGRYALRVMIDLAEHPGEGYVPLTEISERLKISKEYLNSILKILVSNGQLDSLRGKGGGYKLNKAPGEYRVGTILRLAEGDLSAVSCVQPDHSCPNSGPCRSYAMWLKLDSLISDYLDNIYLSDFLENGQFYK